MASQKKAISDEAKVATELFDRAAKTMQETSSDGSLSSYKVVQPGNEFDGALVAQERGEPKAAKK